MKKTLLIWALCIGVMAPEFLTGQSSSYPEDQIIIKFAAGTLIQTQQDIINQMGAIVIDQDDEGDLLLNIPSFPVTVNGVVYSSVVEIIQGGADNAEIDDTDLNYTVSTTPLGYAELLSSLDMDEYSPISEECANEYPGTLTSTTPKTGKIRMAIVDTGIDLEGHDWLAPFVVDGINIISDNSNLFDDNGHGTSVAGIITGMAISAGISPDELELYIVQVFDNEGRATLFDVIKGVKEASSYPIDAMNVSWSYVPVVGDSGSQVLYNYIKKMSNNQNIIIVAGAGNDSENIDYYDCAPANFSGIDNLITVGGLNCDGSHAEGSNYSGRIVEIGAPFESIVCPSTGGYWVYGHTGTSFSAAIVSGALVQVWSTYYLLNDIPFGSSPVVDIIMNTAIKYTQMSDYIEEGRILDIEAACQEAYNRPRGGRFNHYSTSINSTTINNLNFPKRVGLTSKLDPNIYPIPVNDKLYISLKEKLCDNVKVEIWDMLGNKYYEDKIMTDKCFQNFELELRTKIPAGMYFLKFFHRSQTTTKIFVKE